MDLGSQTSAPESAASQQLPSELILEISEALIDMVKADATPKHAFRQDDARGGPARELHSRSSKPCTCSMAMVCRVWRRACAKGLFTRIVIWLPLIDELIDHLRFSTNHVSPHAQFLTIRGGPSTIEFTKWCQLLSLLPHVVSWHCERDLGDMAQLYHHRRTRIVSLLPGPATPFSRIEHLTLSRWTIASPVYLLDLLACFPALETLVLHSVSFNGSGVRRVRRSPWPTGRLQRISARNCSNIGFLAHWWYWRRDHDLGCPSLMGVEARIIAEALDSAPHSPQNGPGLQQVQIEKSPDMQGCTYRAIISGTRLIM